MVIYKIKKIHVFYVNHNRALIVKMVEYTNFILQYGICWYILEFQEGSIFGLHRRHGLS